MDAKISSKVLSFIEKWPIYKNDINDPNFMTYEEIRDIQNNNLRKQIQLVANFSPYYKEMFQKHKIDPDKIKTTDDLVHIPLTYKKD